MSNTKRSFRDKWNNNPKLALAATLNEKSEIFNWILRRNGFKNVKALVKFLRNKKRVLDAGCGNGRVTALLRKYSDEERTQIIGIDLVSAKIGKENLKTRNVYFYKKDLTRDLSSLGKFDFIYCQEVLHHVKNPRKAFKNLAKILNHGGELAIYVYKRKSPIREFTDDYVKKFIAHLPYNEAIKMCEQITRLGKMLSESKVSIKTPEVKALGIPAGRYDLQRFIYHFFVKCFWNDELSLKENAAINYDYHHPEDCQKYDVKEIRGWFKGAGLVIVHELVDFYGITIRGRRE